MIKLLSRIYTGTIQYIQDIGSIVDIAIFLIAAAVCCYAVVIVVTGFIYILSSVYDEIMR